MCKTNQSADVSKPLHREPMGSEHERDEHTGGEPEEHIAERTSCVRRSACEWIIDKLVVQ